MKKQLIAAMVVASMAVSQASYAAQTPPKPSEPVERSHNEELIGLTSGIVLGAVVAGPVGAIIGAFTGGFVGKSVGDDEALQAQRAVIDAKELELAALNHEKASLVALSEQYFDAQQQLSRLKQAQEQRLTELALGLNVQFKTGSSTIEPHFRQQLDEVAYAMSLSPELTLDLTGYADRRGESSYNQALSEQRVAEVKSYLVKQGVSDERLNYRAYGASSPLAQEQSLENDFFDRRVTLKLESQQGELAANTER